MSNLKFRQQVEKTIVRKVVECIIAADYHVQAFYDLAAEDKATKKTKDVEKIMAVMFETDDASIEVWRRDGNERLGWVQFVYGNDGYNVVHDYTTNLDNILKPAFELADKLERGEFQLLVA